MCSFLKEVMFFCVTLTFLLAMPGVPMVFFSVISPLLYSSVVHSSWTMWPELESICTHKALLVLRCGRHHDVQ